MDKIFLSSLLEQGSWDVYHLHSQGVPRDHQPFAFNSSRLSPLSASHPLPTIVLPGTLPSNKNPHAGSAFWRIQAKTSPTLPFTQTPHNLLGNPVGFSFNTNPGFDLFLPPSLLFNRSKPLPSLTWLVNTARVILLKCKSVHAVIFVSKSLIESYLI